jgi:hypothetical protein
MSNEKVIDAVPFAIEVPTLVWEKNLQLTLQPKALNYTCFVALRKELRQRVTRS